MRCRWEHVVETGDAFFVVGVQIFLFRFTCRGSRVDFDIKDEIITAVIVTIETVLTLAELYLVLESRGEIDGIFTTARENHESDWCVFATSGGIAPRTSPLGALNEGNVFGPMAVVGVACGMRGGGSGETCVVIVVTPVFSFRIWTSARTPSASNLSPTVTICASLTEWGYRFVNASVCGHMLSCCRWWY